MSKHAPRIIFLLLLSVLASTWFFYPSAIGSSNKELESFFSGSFLSVLGFVISVTIASCSNLHLKLTQMEKEGMGPFPGTKAKIRASAYSLIFLFGAAFLGLAFKGAVATGGERWDAAWNGLFIAMIYFFVSVLLDIARTSFKIS